jgi:hypothetical protein
VFPAEFFGEMGCGCFNRILIISDKESANEAKRGIWYRHDRLQRQSAGGYFRSDRLWLRVVCALRGAQGAILHHLCELTDQNRTFRRCTGVKNVASWIVFFVKVHGRGLEWTTRKIFGVAARTATADHKSQAFYLEQAAVFYKPPPHHSMKPSHPLIGKCKSESPEIYECRGTAT